MNNNSNNFLTKLHLVLSACIQQLSWLDATSSWDILAIIVYADHTNRQTVIPGISPTQLLSCGMSDETKYKSDRFLHWLSKSVSDASQNDLGKHRPSTWKTEALFSQEALLCVAISYQFPSTPMCCHSSPFL